MPNTFDGATGSVIGRFGIVMSRDKEHITAKLQAGAIETPRTDDISDGAIDVIWGLGNWEFPHVAQTMAKRYAAIHCLGAVVKGETDDDEHINHRVATSRNQIDLKCYIPALFGVLTCNALEQTVHCTGRQVDNKRQECAAALETGRLPKIQP
jgi:6,7-dimethyl-8-ribityllumazine synthase